MYKQIVAGVSLLSSLLIADSASAQPRRWERERGRAEVGRSAAQLQDDVRDLQRFRATHASFEDAWRRQDLIGVRNALRSFVFQGRAEVAEQQREAGQSFREAQRSNREFARDGSRKDFRDAQDDRRDAYRDRVELAQEAAALNELERAASAAFTFGPSVPVLVQARDAMLRFIQLAEVEVRRSRRELHEDVRELREDNRDAYRGPRRGF